MEAKAVLIFSLLCALSLVTAQKLPMGAEIKKADGYKLMAQCNSTGSLSSLYAVESDAYGYPIQIVDLHGSRYDMGYCYAQLVGVQSMENYHNFLDYTLPKKEYQLLLEMFVDWQYSEFLGKGVPDEYKEEMRGAKAYGDAHGLENFDKLLQRFILLADKPGDNSDFKYVFENELLDKILPHTELYKFIKENWGLVMEFVEYFEKHFKRIKCDMYGVWGDRTEQGDLFSSRNLDWAKDTGISRHKLISVFHPPGKVAHATIGFAGVIGAIAGMSDAGLTLHEANLDNKRDSFTGFPWPMRLRYVMENAHDMQEALQIWRTTENTVSFNFGIGSAVDAQNGGHPFVCIETTDDESAFYFDMDPREVSAKYTDPTSGKTSQIGFPMPQAVFRSNHAMDPRIRQTQEDEIPPTNDSVMRYKMMHDIFATYADEQQKIGYVQAVNVTAILGAKGRSHYYQCTTPVNNEGECIMSITFWPIKKQMYVAYEEGTGATWSAASCNTYLHIDMSKFF